MNARPSYTRRSTPTQIDTVCLVIYDDESRTWCLFLTRHTLLLFSYTPTVPFASAYPHLPLLPFIAAPAPAAVVVGAMHVIAHRRVTASDSVISNSVSSSRNTRTSKSCATARVYARVKCTVKSIYICVRACVRARAYSLNAALCYTCLVNKLVHITIYKAAASNPPVTAAQRRLRPHAHVSHYVLYTAKATSSCL